MPCADVDLQFVPNEIAERGVIVAFEKRRNRIGAQIPFTEGERLSVDCANARDLADLCPARNLQQLGNFG